jgi:putative RNA 2'-phosphotransferase
MNYQKLSKEISYALRHAPWEYELEIDSDGFVPIEQLIRSINESGSYERPITKEDLKNIIETSDKQRHEIVNDKIRALYGHSLATHISKDKISPPNILYHGTTHKVFETILIEGLKPMGRQYVHLSSDINTAVQVGKRRDQQPIILKIKAIVAYKNGISFYKGNDKVILADYVPKEYISLL